MGQRRGAAGAGWRGQLIARVRRLGAAGAGADVAARLFRSRAFSAGNAAIFFTFASLFGSVFFAAQLMQTALGYGPLGAGLRLLPWTATFMTVAPIAGALADRIGERPLMVSGLALQAAGMAWMAAVAAPGHAYPSLLGPFIVAGVGMSMAIPSTQNSVLASSAMDALGKAAGVNSMMRELGGVFGVALVVAVFAATGATHRRPRSSTATDRRWGSPPAWPRRERSRAWRCRAAAVCARTRWSSAARSLPLKPIAVADRDLQHQERNPQCDE